MDWDALGYPHYLLFGLMATLVLGGVVAGTTSGTAFGGYNPSWDGTATLRDTASATASETVIATDTNQYGDVTPDETIAVILSPDAPYTVAETETVREFLENGGTVVVADDIGSQSNDLLANLNSSVRINGTLLRDEQNFYRSPALPEATNVSDHRYTEGVETVTLNYPSYLTTRDTASETSNRSQTIVNSSGVAYADRNGDQQLNDDEELRQWPIVAVESVGDGTLIVASDPSIFINSMLERDGNAQFTENLFAEQATVLLDYSHQSATPPLITVVLALQRTPALASLVGFLMAVMIGLVSGRPRAVSQIRRRIGSQSDDPPAPDQERLLTYLRQQHPDWDEERLRRVMKAVLPADSQDKPDE